MMTPIITTNTTGATIHPSAKVHESAAMFAFMFFLGANELKLSENF